MHVYNGCMNRAKVVASQWLYCIGDWISRQYLFQQYGMGFKLYQWIMLQSVDLDTHGKIWKHVSRPSRKMQKKQ